MSGAAVRARAAGRLRRGPAVPGFIGRWFVRMLEPPVQPRFKSKAPRAIRPRPAPPLAEAFTAFMSSQQQVRAFLRRLRRPGPDRRAIPESVRSRRPLQPGHRIQRHRRPRAPSSVAGLASAERRDSRQSAVGHRESQSSVLVVSPSHPSSHSTPARLPTGTADCEADCDSRPRRSTADCPTLRRLLYCSRQPEACRRARKMKHTVVVVASAFVALISPLSAQQAPAPTFRSGLEILTVEASVRDAAGRPITDLQAV